MLDLLDKPQHFHIVPEDDLNEHILDLDCLCEPHLDGGIIIHNSYDCREYLEEGNDKYDPNLAGVINIISEGNGTGRYRRTELRTRSKSGNRL